MTSDIPSNYNIIHATGRISRMEGHHHTNFPYNDGNQFKVYNRVKLTGPTHEP